MFENTFENIVYKMVAILSRLQFMKRYILSQSCDRQTFWPDFLNATDCLDSVKFLNAFARYAVCFKLTKYGKNWPWYFGVSFLYQHRWGKSTLRLGAKWLYSTFCVAVITYPCHNFNHQLNCVEVKTWTNNHIPHKTMAKMHRMWCLVLIQPMVYLCLVLYV